MLFDAVFPSWLALLGCVAIDFGLDISNYAYIGSDSDDPKAPVAVGINSSTAVGSTPLPYLVTIGAGTVSVGVLLTVVAFAFVPITLLIPIFAVRFTTSLVFSWGMIGIAPSRKAKIGIAFYVLGLGMLLKFQSPTSTVPDSSQILSLYTSLPYLIFVTTSFTAFLFAMLLLNFSNSFSDNVPLSIGASVLMGSQAPVLAKQFISIMVMAFLKKSLSEAINLYTVVIVTLSCASYWFWDRRLRACLSQIGHDKETIEMHIAFNIMALLNGVLVFREYQHWNLMIVISVPIVLVGISLLAQEKFVEISEKEIGEANRRSSWKEIMRKASGRGSEIMRIGQPPALALPVRNMVNIVFAPPPSTAPKKSSLLVTEAALRVSGGGPSFFGESLSLHQHPDALKRKYNPC